MLEKSPPNTGAVVLVCVAVVEAVAAAELPKFENRFEPALGVWALVLVLIFGAVPVAPPLSPWNRLGVWLGVDEGRFDLLTPPKRPAVTGAGVDIDAGVLLLLSDCGFEVGKPETSGFCWNRLAEVLPVVEAGPKSPPEG